MSSKILNAANNVRMSSRIIQDVLIDLEWIEFARTYYVRPHKVHVCVGPEYDDEGGYYNTISSWTVTDPDGNECSPNFECDSLRDFDPDDPDPWDLDDYLRDVASDNELHSHDFSVTVDPQPPLGKLRGELSNLRDLITNAFSQGKMRRIIIYTNGDPSVGLPGDYAELLIQEDSWDCSDKESRLEHIHVLQKCLVEFFEDNVFAFFEEDGPGDHYPEYEPGDDELHAIPADIILEQWGVCPHGNTGICDACISASDFEFDANRERRTFS